MRTKCARAIREGIEVARKAGGIQFLFVQDAQKRMDKREWRAFWRAYMRTENGE